MTKSMKPLKIMAFGSEIEGRPREVAAAAGGPFTSGMIALVPSDEDLDRIVMENGTPRNELHLTYGFLGESDQYSEEQKRTFTLAVESTANKLDGPIIGNAFAASMFNPHGDDPCWVMGVGGSKIKSARDQLWRYMVSTLDEVTMENIPMQHEPFVAHVTLTYTNSFDVLPQVIDRLGDITFDKIRLSWADEVNEDFQL